MTDHAKHFLEPKWVSQKKSGAPEDQITYHLYLHVRKFIYRREAEERAIERGGEDRRLQNRLKKRGAKYNQGGMETIKKGKRSGLPKRMPEGRLQIKKELNQEKNLTKIV